MKSVVVTGKTKDEAITNALVQLGCTSDHVNIEVVEESKGVFGLFGKSVTIKATVKEEADEKSAETAGDTKGQKTKTPVTKVQESKAEKPQAKTAAEPLQKVVQSPADQPAANQLPADKKAAGKPYEKAEKAVKGSTDVKAAEPAKEEVKTQTEVKAPSRIELEAVTVNGEKVVIDDTIEQRIRQAKLNESADTDRDQDSYRRNRRPSDRQRRSGRYHERRPQNLPDREVENEQEMEPLPEKPVFEQKVYEIPADADQVMEQTRDFLTKTLKAMGIDAVITTEFSEDGIMNVNIEGEGMGIIIGKRGQTLDSLQYLTTLVINKNRQDHVRMKLDTENYRARRQETLEKLALNLAKKAKRTGHRVVLEPMNPYERRIIHSVRQPDRDVETHSDGEEPYRKVIITPRRRSYKD